MLLSTRLLRTNSYQDSHSDATNLFLNTNYTTSLYSEHVCLISKTLFNCPILLCISLTLSPVFYIIIIEMFCANTYHINSIDKMYQPLLLTLDEQTILKNLNLLLAHWVTHTYISGPVGLPTSYCSLRLLVYFCDPWSQPNNIYKNQNTLKWLTDIKEYVNPPTSKANYLRKTNFCHTNDTMITTNSINDINENDIGNTNTINPFRTVTVNIRHGPLHPA